jgi:hypothetical protein
MVAAASRPVTKRRAGGNPRGIQRPVRSLPAPIELPSSELATEVAAATTRQPFHPPSDEITTRPWPRAVISDAAAAGALTVGFGDSSAPSPSFYPFEPRPASETQPTDKPQR